MGDEIRITPGGFITSKPRHMLGEHGASPFLTSPFTIEGFQNLINYYGGVAWPLFNSAGDPQITQATNFLGGDSATGQNVIDMTKQAVMSTVVQAIAGDAQLNVNGEFAYQGGGYTIAVQTPTASEPFTTAGTITITAGSPTVAGAGTAWNTDVLTGPYALTPNINTIQRGDILQVLVSAGRYFYFRIITQPTANAFDIWPTPTAGNAAIGAGKTYKILRTGYNSYSRVLSFNVPQGSGNIYYYYCGNLGHTNPPNGTIECAAKIFPNNYFTHFMSPRTTDSAGLAVADLLADDLIYYKGFILYAAGSSVSWSAPGAPSALPFGTADFPAKNISIVDATSKFVSLEYLGDQVVAFFEDSMWLVSATGSVPEFTFYKLPELESIINPSRADPSGAAVIMNYGRPSASGRGAIYYTSNRGVEKLPGALADEISAPISTSLRALFAALPLYVGWDNAEDTVLVRAALGVTNPTSLVYNVAQNEWSTLRYGAPIDGSFIAGLTPSINTKTNAADHTRLIHYGYYETPISGTSGATTGGNVRFVAALLDENTPTAGLVAWEWLTPMIPLGLSYGDYSTGGFIFDAYSLNTLPVSVDWVMYFGESPYNIAVWDAGTMSFAGSLPSPWVSSRQRLSKKSDAPFVMFKFSSKDWVAPVALTLFKSDTQTKR